MINTSKIYTSKSSGQFKIIEYVNSKNITIEFIATGYQAKVNSSNIYAGAAKDLMHKSVHGVGFIGQGNTKRAIKGKATKAYITWSDMLQRCYSEKEQARKPCYKGCSVHRDWHNFQVFAEWFDRNYIEGYQLDKDIKIEGNRVYSADACLFVSGKENVIKASAKSITLLNPDGKVVEIYNISQFARDNNLDNSHLFKVSTGKSKSHKGWTKA